MGLLPYRGILFSRKQVRSILVVLFYCHIFPISIEMLSFISADWMSTAKTAKITCPLKYPVLQYSTKNKEAKNTRASSRE